MAEPDQTLTDPDALVASPLGEVAVTPELEAVSEADAGRPPPGPPPDTSWWHSAWVGVGGLVVGIALIVIAMAAMTDVTATIRVVVGVVGLAACFVGIDRLLERRFGPNVQTGVWLAAVWLGIVVLAAIFADVLPLSESRNAANALTEPTLLRPDLLSDHPLGTDRQGLDILGGVVYGARVSLVVGFGAVLIGMFVGGLIGVLSGFYRGGIESGVSLVTDAMLAFPPLILLLGMVAVLDANVRNVTIALAIIVIPTYVRLSRANTMVFAQREFVLASRTLGAKNRTIISREIVPNVALPVMSFAFTYVAVLIVAEASLSFLGLSIQRPNPSWGNMVAAGQTDFDRHPHLVFVPSIVLFTTVYSLNLLGDAARKHWDPREGRL